MLDLSQKNANSFDVNASSFRKKLLEAWAAEPGGRGGGGSAPPPPPWIRHWNLY